MPATVYFDLDGTLTDPFEGIGRCIRYALEPFDVPSPDDAALRGFIGPPLLNTFAALLGEQRAGKALDRYRQRFDDVGWRENRPYDGIEDALAGLRSAGLTLCVATSKPTVFAERIIEHFGFAPHFAGVFGAELNGTRSDKTELLAWILERQGGVARSVMVGDRRHDMIGAINNNMFAIGVAWGYGSVDELEAAGAEHVVHAPVDITRLLIEP